LYPNSLKKDNRSTKVMYAQIAKDIPAGEEDDMSGTKEDLQEESLDEEAIQGQREVREATRRSRLTSRKSIGRRSPKLGHLSAKKKVKIQDRALVERYEELKRQEEAVLEFSPGPTQVKPTKMMQMMKKEVERRVEIELKKHQRNKGQPSIAKKLFEDDSDLFVSPEEDKEVEMQYRRRMEMMIEADEARRQKENQRKKKAWFDEQSQIKELQRQLHEEKIRNQELEKKWMESQWEAQYEEGHAEEDDDGLNRWYEDEEKDQDAATGKSANSEGLGSSTFSVIPNEASPKGNDDSISTRELLKIMFQQHEKTLERVLNATTPTKDEAKKMESRQEKEELILKMEDQRIKALELEELGEVTEGNSSIKCGDWLHRITPTINNLSKRAGEFWKEGLELVSRRYQAYLEATPLQRLEMEHIEEEIEVDEKYAKVRSVLTEMLLKAIPKSISAEAITKRLENPLQILLLVIVKYQPGGRREREAVLSQITNPEVCWSEDKALEGIRTWKRRIERARELKLVIPDPSVLLAALDSMTEKIVKKDPRKSFRVESLREQIKVDILPTYKAVESLTTFIEAELEEAVTTTMNPKVKSINPKDDRKGKGSDDHKGSGKGDSKGSKGKDDAKGKGKKGKTEPCKYFASEEGCRFGQTCKSYHRTLKPDEGKCYICGSTKHQAHECDRPKRSSSLTSAKGDQGKKGKNRGKSDAGKGPVVKPVQPERNKDEHEAPSPNRRELRQEGSDPREPEREPEKVIEAFQTMMIKALKEGPKTTQGEELDTLIGSLKKKLEVNVKVIKVRKITSEVRYGLLDSGATNNVRELEESEDLQGVIPIDVEVAFEGTVNAQLFMNKEGTILGPKGTEAIVSMNLLVEELGYEVSWNEKKLEVSKEGHYLPVVVMNGTPMLPYEDSLKLIHEIEEKKRRRVKSVKTQTDEADFQIGSIWPQLKDLITWLMKNDIMKGIELLKLCICRRRREVEAEEKRIEDQMKSMMNQVHDRSQKRHNKILIEVCCYEDSKLAERFKQRGGSAIRLSLPKHDISQEVTIEAVKRTVKILKSEDFEVIYWISVPCSPWCTWQRVNLKVVDDYQKVLEEKRRESLTLVNSVKKMIENSKDDEAYFEWPSRNDGWKQKEVQNLLEGFPFEAEIDGCAYGLKSSDGRPMKKTWKIKSTSKKVEDYLHRRCEGHKVEHAQVRGKEGKASENYTEEMVEEIVNCMFDDGYKPIVKPMKKTMTTTEIEEHRRRGHIPYDGRCKDCLLGGIKDRPHFRRSGREENVLSVDVAGRYRRGKGPEGECKYLLVAAFKASQKKWADDPEDFTDEMKINEEVQAADPEDIFHEESSIVVKMIRPKAEAGSPEKEKTSSEAAQEARSVLEEKKKAMEIAETALSQREEADFERSPSKEASEKTSKGRGPKQTFQFVKFKDIPRTVERFDEMKRTWINFEYALQKIGLNASELRERLVEGKPPYNDAERMEERCKSVLKACRSGGDWDSRTMKEYLAIKQRQRKRQEEKEKEKEKEKSATVTRWWKGLSNRREKETEKRAEGSTVSLKERPQETSQSSRLKGEGTSQSSRMIQRGKSVIRMARGSVKKMLERRSPLPRIRHEVFKSAEQKGSRIEGKKRAQDEEEIPEEFIEKYAHALPIFDQCTSKCVVRGCGEQCMMGRRHDGQHGCDRHVSTQAFLKDGKKRSKEVEEWRLAKAKKAWIKSIEEEAVRKERNQDQQKEGEPELKIWPKSAERGMCVEDCQVKVEKNGKMVICGKTCDVYEVHSTKKCKCRVHRLTHSLEKETLKREQKKRKDPVQLIPREDRQAEEPIVIPDKEPVIKVEEEQEKSTGSTSRRAKSSTSRRVTLEDNRPFTFTEEEEKRIKEEYARERKEEERLKGEERLRKGKGQTSAAKKSKDREVSLKVIRLKGLKTTDEKSTEDRRQMGENDDRYEAAEEWFPDEVKEEVDQDVDEDDILKALQESLEEADDAETDENVQEEVQIPLKQMMIFVTPLKTKASNEVELAIKEIILYIQRKLKYKVERLHSDPGTELNTKRMKEWCADNNIRRTSSVPEDAKANGSAEAAVGLIKRQTRAVLQESGLEEEFWPFAALYAAKQREKFALKEEPLLKLGTKVIVKKRVSRNRRIKGFEAIGLTAKYLGPITETTDGHYVLLEDGRTMKTTRIAVYSEEEQHEEDEELQRLGWKWVTDPDGRVFYINEKTNEKSWTTPLRLEEVSEEVPGETDEFEEEVIEELRKRRLHGKQQPPKAFLKAIKATQDDEEDEVTKTVTLQEVYQNLEDWIPGMRSELESQYTKGCLIPRKITEIEESQKRSNVKLKTLPSKLVATKKKKPNVPMKMKARLVACGNMAEEDDTKDTYAGGADATAVRSAIRQAALKSWQIRTKDVSTAFLNAKYEVEGEILILIPPKVFIKAGLVQDDEVWEVKMAIYGLKESPLLWAKERDRCLKQMKVKFTRKDSEEEEVYQLRRFEADVNTWHIVKEGSQEAKGLLLTYVDDIMVTADEELAKAMMQRIDEQWKCSPEEIVEEGKDPISFCGICIEKGRKGYFIHQKPYIKDLLKKHRMDDCSATKILLDKESDQSPQHEEPRGQSEDDEESDKSDGWKKTPEFIEGVRKAQQVAGEILWLSTRTRPDLCYPIQKMTSAATKDPSKSNTIGTRILRYLKGTKDFGMMYLNKEETKKKYEEMKMDWPKEALDEGRVTVWTDSSFASQEKQKSQRALVVTQQLAPVFWKCGTQSLISLSTAEAELQMLTEGSLAAQNIGLLIKEVTKLPKRICERQETIKELEEREEFNDEEEILFADEDLEDLLCVDNKAATQILVQESGSWRTRHLRVRASSLKQRIEAGRQKVCHIPGRAMMADLNTKSHPYGRLYQLRQLWGIQELQEDEENEAESKVNKVRIKMVRNVPKVLDPGRLNDIEEEEDPVMIPSEIEERLNRRNKILDEEEQEARRKFAEIISERDSVLEEHLKFSHEMYHIQKKRIEALKGAYEDEKRFREDAELEAIRWKRFIKEAGMMHPRGEEENLKNEQEAEEEERRQANLLPKRKAPPPELPKELQEAAQKALQGGVDPAKFKKMPAGVPPPKTEGPGYTPVKQPPTVKKPPPPIAPMVEEQKSQMEAKPKGPLPSVGLMMTEVRPPLPSGLPPGNVSGSGNQPYRPPPPGSPKNIPPPPSRPVPTPTTPQAEAKRPEPPKTLVEMTTPPKKEETKAERLKRELEEIEAAEQRRAMLATRRKNQLGQNLLSYEEGFDWCSTCQYVSVVSKISELKYISLKGCQRRTCPSCFQWTLARSPYEPDDFLFEGPKEVKDCPWFTSGRGCPRGNKCDMRHPKWDESERLNKGRCYVCGERGDHRSQFCERPGGGMERTRFEDNNMFRFGWRELPCRPNGSIPDLPPHRDEEKSEVTQQQQMDPVKMELEGRARRIIKKAQIDLSRGYLSEEVNAELQILATMPEDYSMKAEVIDTIDEVRVQLRILEIQRKSEQNQQVEGTAQRGSSTDDLSQAAGPKAPVPRINAVKVIKVEVEDDESEAEIAKRFLKTVLAAVGVQIILNWLYGRCKRRALKSKTEEVCTDDEDAVSDEDFELVSEAGTGGAPEEARKEEKDQKNPDPEKDEEREGQKIYVTRNGEAFHVKKTCGHLKHSVFVERSPCERCHYRTKAIVGIGSQTRPPIEVYFEGSEICLTTTDQKYHHESCKEVRRMKTKDKRTKCLDCIKWFESKSKIEEDDNGLSQHHEGEGNGSSSSSKNCKKGS